MKAEDECPGLSSNARLVQGTFDNARDAIAAAIVKGYQAVAAKNPELVKSNPES